MTPAEFTQSNEYKSSSESAKYVYQERIAILCDDRTPDFFEHQLAYQDFKQAVELERGLIE